MSERERERGGGDLLSNLTLLVHSGPLYSFTATRVTPATDFSGDLVVPVTVTDGVVESDVSPLNIAVTPVNDPPAINGQRPVYYYTTARPL